MAATCKYILKFLLPAFLLLIISTNSAAILVDKKILVLHSYHEGYYWTDKLDEGILTTLEKHDDIEVYVEYMDLIRNPEEKFCQLLKDIYYQRYTLNEIIFDAIIVADDAAFNFLTEHREELFPGIPIVFLGVDDFSPDRISGKENISGVLVEASIKETLEVVLKLHENVERIAVVSGSRLTEKIFLKHFIEDAKLFKEKLDFIYFAELEPEGLKDSLSALGKNDVVFYLSYLLTPSGKTLTVAESLSFITSATDLPIYTIREFALFHGAIGGKVIHGFSHGKAAAKIAIDIINGSRETPLRIERSNRFLFSGSALATHNIPENELPENSFVIHRKPDFLIMNWNELTEDKAFGYDMFENHIAIMMLIDAETGQILDANRAAFNFYGYPDLIGMYIQEINTISWEEINEEIEIAREMNMNHFNFKHILSDGRIRDVESFAKIITINENPFYFTIVNDVTEKRQAMKLARQRDIIILFISAVTILFLLFLAILLVRKHIKIINQKKAIQSSEMFFRQLIEMAPVGVVLLDKFQNTLYLNKQFNEMCGYTMQDIPSVNDWWGLAYPNSDYRTQVKNVWGKHFASNFQYYDKPLEFEVTCKDGSKKWIEFLMATTGELNIITYNDVTSFKDTEQSLNKVNKNIEELLSLASHDLKTPLVSIDGYTNELLSNHADKLDESGVHFLKRLNVNSQRMHKLINSLLDISMIKLGGLQKEDINLNVLIDDVIKDLDFTIEQAGIDIEIPKLPSVCADKHRMSTVFRNILLNAVFYGKSRVKISYNDNILSFTDDGIGVSAEYLERIFMPGERLQKKKVEGVGMGLAFCKKAILQHDGKIWAESEGENKGTTIKIKFSPETLIN